MTNRIWICLFTLFLLPGCTRERTQLMMRIRTDMTQGIGQQLAAVRINVYSDGQTEPTHSTTVPLGADGVFLPQTLGLVPRGSHDARISATLEALGDGGAILFTKRVAARYVPQRTLLLDVMLAARCLDVAAQSCPSEQSCGASGCETDLRENLPSWSGDAPDGTWPTDKTHGQSLLEGLVDPDPFPAWLTAADLDYYVAEFERSGFRGPLNRYRNHQRDFEYLSRFEGRKIEQPSLFVGGERDLVLSMLGRGDLLAIMGAEMTDLRGADILPGCGHWTQQERPAEVNARLMPWLASL